MFWLKSFSYLVGTTKISRELKKVYELKCILLSNYCKYRGS